MPSTPPVEGGSEIVLAPGQTVTLNLLGREFARGPFASVIEAMGDHALYVLPPLERREVVTVPLGAHLRVGLRHGGDFYAFQSEVVEHVFHPQALLGLSLPQEMERRDQRSYYRLDYTLQPESAVQIDGGGESGDALRATIVNLSGGGVEIVAPQPIRPGVLLALRFRLDDLRIATVAQAVRIESPAPGRFNYRAHCQFLQLPRLIREGIVRWVARQQVARARQGAR